MTRLKLRDDAYYAPTDDGICILTNSGEVELTGPSIYQWVDRLAPYLDGRYTLAELTASMPAPRQVMTERIVTTLRERGVVVEAGDTAGQPPGAAGVADRTVVLVGSGRLAEEIVAAAQCVGLRLTASADFLSHGDGGVVAGADLVIYAGDRPSAGGAEALDRACIRAGVALVAAIVDGDEAWLGPFGEPLGWMAAWRRVLAGSATENPTTGDPGSTATITVVANQLMREVVRRLSDASARSGPARMTRIELPSLRSHRHNVAPHPFAQAARPADRAPRPAVIAELRRGERVEAEEFDRRVTAGLDARVGLLGDVTERDFIQIPLAVSQVEVSDPVLLAGPGRPRPVVTGADLSLAEARRAAVRRGLAAYGCLMVDPRRLHVRPTTSDPRTGDPARDLAGLRAGEWTGFVWGHRLADGQPHEVPAESVFPALVDSGSMSPTGAAAGLDWNEAVATGLIAQCRRLTLIEAADGGHPIQVDWERTALDDRGERYRELVRIVGGQLDVYDVTGSVGVPTLAFRLDGTTLAYASGLSFGDALRDGLAEVLLARQAELDHEAGYAPPPVPPLHNPERRTLSRPCPSWTTDEASIVTRLAQLGWTAVAVPLDHDPAVTALLPYLVHIVLTRD